MYVYLTCIHALIRVRVYSSLSFLFLSFFPLFLFLFNGGYNKIFIASVKYIRIGISLSVLAVYSSNVESEINYIVEEIKFFDGIEYSRIELDIVDLNVLIIDST